MRLHVFLPFVATSAVLGLCVENANATEVTIVSSRGSVSVTQGTHVIPASASTQLTLPAQIRTGSDGTLDLKDKDSLVHIGPNSTVALPDTGPSGSLVDRYLQSAGSALYNIQSRHGRPMSVETPYLVSVVKGTVFTIAVEEGAASVTLMDGSLDVSAPGVREHVLLKPNQSIRHNSGESSLVVSPVGAAPPNMTKRTTETAAPVTNEANAAEVALVARDLAEVGASVSTQHALLAASVAHGSATGTASNGGDAAGSSNTGPAKTPSNSGSPSTATGGMTSSNPVAAGPSTPTSSNTGSSAAGSNNGSATGTSSGASGSSTSGSNNNSGSTNNSGSSNGSGSNQTSPSGSSGSSGATGSGSSSNTNNGSSGSDGSTSTSPGIGCNGKTNGTGQGNCLGHGKNKT